MKKNNKDKVVVTMPAYFAERTVEAIYKGIDKKIVDDVILVDDASKDTTTKVSKKLGITTFTHKKNKGYGGNQKTCYTNALKTNAEFIIMLHPDGQYNPKDLPKFVDALKKGKADLILGSRFLKGGDKETPFYKAISIRFITMLFDLILGLKLTEVNTGYRGYTRKLLETIPFRKNGNGYIFDPQLLIQAVYFGFKIGEVPVTKAYNPERIEPNFKKSLEHGLENLKLLIQYVLHRLRVVKIHFLTP